MAKFQVFLLLCVAAVSLSTADNNIGQFWHVTDFHYDHTFATSGLSCVKNVTRAADLGDQWCDASWTLVTRTLAAMGHIQPDVDFVLWTGDTVAHISNADMTVEVNMDVVQNLTTALRQAFPNTPVFPTFGNHDYYPASQFPATPNLIYNETAKIWRDWIGDEEQLANFRKGGYYTRLLPPSGKVRLVALNTNLYYKSDKATVGIPDPAGQLDWFTGILGQARRDGEKVVVAAHIAPGVHTPRGVQWYQDAFLTSFTDVITKYADVIIAMHCGHDHYDGFKVIMDSHGSPAVPIFVAPSVTPWRFILGDGETGAPHNPSVRLVTYRRDTGRHLALTQHVLHFDRALANGGEGGFTPLYNFTQRYDVTDLSAASLDDVITRMEGADREGLLDAYCNFSMSGAPHEPCDVTCKTRILCGFRLFTAAQYEQCVTSNPANVTSGLRISIVLAAAFVLAGHLLCAAS